MVFVPFDSRPWGLILIFTVGGAILAALLGLPLAVLAVRRWTADFTYSDGT
jgi:F0F1-type ATP synthase assembly protein I